MQPRYLPRYPVESAIRLGPPRRLWHLPIPRYPPTRDFLAAAHYHKTRNVVSDGGRAQLSEAYQGVSLARDSLWRPPSLVPALAFLLHFAVSVRRPVG